MASSNDHVQTRKIHKIGCEQFKDAMASNGFVEVYSDPKHPIDPKSLRIGEFAYIPRHRIQVGGLMPRDFVIRINCNSWISVKVHAILSGEVHTSFWRSASYALESKEPFYLQVAVGVSSNDIALANSLPETLKVLREKVKSTKHVALIISIDELFNGEFARKVKSKEYLG
jgi:hypothetical protein